MFNDEVIKELANIMAEQDANKIAKNVLKEMNIKSIGLNEKLKDAINKALTI